MGTPVHGRSAKMALKAPQKKPSMPPTAVIATSTLFCRLHNDGHVNNLQKLRTHLWELCGFLHSLHCERLSLLINCKQHSVDATGSEALRLCTRGTAGNAAARSQGRYPPPQESPRSSAQFVLCVRPQRTTGRTKKLSMN